MKHKKKKNKKETCYEGEKGADQADQEDQEEDETMILVWSFLPAARTASQQLVCIVRNWENDRLGFKMRV